MQENTPAQTLAPSTLCRPPYRADVDGLRAVAVIAVVGFHAFPSSVHGGFTGVDIFFVISGFLISTLIFNNLDRDRFSFGEFYGRRIKRLFPALLLVLFASWAFSEFALLPDEYSQLGKHILGGAGFVSNFFFWRESGYFDDAAITKPLLHLWSLSVEEQFYLVWPLLVCAVWKTQKKTLLAVILGIIAASFALNVNGVRQHDPGAFYFPQTRFWELLIGALLAYAALYGKAGFTFFPARSTETINSTSANLLSLAGAALIAAGFLLIDRDARFPGWWALLPTCGTALLIVAGPLAWFNRVILSQRTLVGIGLISYPLYLWHWPILSFAQILLSDTPSPVIRLSAILASIALAWLTYTFIERPVRSGFLNRPSTPAILVVLMSLMGGTGYYAYFNGPLIFGLKDRDNIQMEFDALNPSAFRRVVWDTFGHECNFVDFAAIVAGNRSAPPRETIDPSCIQRDPSKPKSVFLWGSSYAQMLRYGLKKQLPADWQLLQVATSACLPNFKDSNVPGCAPSNGLAIDTIKSLKPDVVLVATNVHDSDEAQTINDTLLSYGVGKVVFTGPPVPWTAALPKIVARQLRLLNSERTFIGVHKETMEKYRVLRQAYIAKGLNYVDLTEIFCNPQGCLTRIGNDIKAGMVTYDSSHLMPIGSEYLARNGLVAAVIGDRR